MSCQYLRATGVLCIIILNYGDFAIDVCCIFSTMQPDTRLFISPCVTAARLAPKVVLDCCSSSWCILSLCHQLDVRYISDQVLQQAQSTFLEHDLLFILIFLSLCDTNLEYFHFSKPLASSVILDVVYVLCSHKQLAKAKWFSFIDSDSSFNLVHDSITL